MFTTQFSTFHAAVRTLVHGGTVEHQRVSLSYDNEIDNGNDPDDDFKKQEATDIKYNKDCFSEEYLGNIPVQSKLDTSGILTNEKSKAENDITEEKLLNYEDIRKYYESDNNEEVYEKALTTKSLNSRRKIFLENRRSFRAYISR